MYRVLVPGEWHGEIASLAEGVSGAEGTGTEIFARLMLMTSQNPEWLTWFARGVDLTNLLALICR